MRIKWVSILLALSSVFLTVGVSAAYDAASVPDGAAISGKIVFKGKVPKPKKLLITKNKEVCGEGYIERQELKVSKGGALTEVVVSLQSVKKGKAWSKPAGGYLLDQKKCTFLPYLQVVPKRAKLTVVNSDPVLHIIHTYELIGGARRSLFNIAQPRLRQRITRTVKPRHGGAVRVECDAHNWMLGWMYVVDNPYYAVVADDGGFTIKDIPPGKYKLKAWHPFLGTEEKKISVSAKGKVELNFEFSR